MAGPGARCPGPIDLRATPAAPYRRLTLQAVLFDPDVHPTPNARAGAILDGLAASPARGVGDGARDQVLAAHVVLTPIVDEIGAVARLAVEIDLPVPALAGTDGPQAALQVGEVGA